MKEKVLAQELKQGDRIQFRKAGGWQGEEGPWRNGTLVEDLGRCWRVQDAGGETNEYWKHRIEIRSVPPADIQEPQGVIVDRFVASPYSYYGESSRARSWSIWDRKERRWLPGINGAVVATKGDAEVLARKLNAEGEVDHGAESSDVVEQCAPPAAVRVSYDSTLVLVKRVDQALHLLDLFAENAGCTLTNAIDRRFQAHVLRALGLFGELPERFTWLLYGTDAWMSRYECPGFVPIGSYEPDPEMKDRMLQLYPPA